MSGQLPLFRDPLTAGQLNQFVLTLEDILRGGISNNRQIASHVLDPGSGSHTGTLTAGYGGTGQTSYVAGDLLYASGAAAISKLVVGAPGQALIVSAGNLPVWGSAGVTDHGALTGLVPDDDHTQYTLLAGRAGGQTLSGGTAASNTLLLRSTTHGTKGNVVIESTSGFVAPATMGFFALTPPVARTAVANAGAIGCTGYVPDLAYSQNEVDLFNALITDMTNVWMKLNEALNVLRTYNLI